MSPPSRSSTSRSTRRRSTCLPPSEWMTCPASRSRPTPPPRRPTHPALAEATAAGFEAESIISVSFLLFLFSLIWMDMRFFIVCRSKVLDFYLDCSIVDLGILV
ncbi:hypothetical protein Cni_G07457 [Canna indica]|uniref:Uncharacterized protein n=1 Tax=Canna indica TaxID=4628 RepID=A0AAQ3Q4W7_9LILI|nr:hypothetical protein Cni_G07457 [Canna indica]